jgi:iron complex outermembrane receptor protein
VPTKNEELVLDQPKVRGFSAEIYVDGLPAYGATAVIDPTTLVNVERIDVAKGPASALYAGGVGAPLGGLINLETKSPDYAAARRVVGLRAGSFSTFGTEVDFNQPLGSDARAAFRLTADYGSAESHLDAVESERYSINPSLALRLAPRTELVIKGQFTKVSQLEYSGLPAALFDPSSPNFAANLDRERFPGAFDTPDTTVENRLLTSTLRHEFSDDWSATLRGRIYRSEFEEYSTFASQNGIFFLGIPAASGTTYGVASAYLPTEVDQKTVTFQIDGRFETGPINHRLAAGVDYDTVDYAATLGFASIGTIDFNSPANTLSYVKPAPFLLQDDTYRTTALWVQDQIELPGRVHLLGGLRYTRIEIQERSAGLENGYDEITPRIGAAWEFTPGISVFAARSEGFRAPWSVTLAPGNTLKPESSVHHEAGFKFQHKPSRLHGSVSVFELERSNVAVGFPSVQTGEQRSRGVETDLIWEPTPAFSLLTAYAYTDGEVTSDTTAANVGSDLPKIPLHSGRLTARYRFQSDALKGLGVGAGVTAASSRAIKIPAAYRADAYHAFDAQASYSFGRYTIGLSVANLTDEDYLEAYQYLSADILMPAQPRTFTVKVQVDF